MSDGDRGKVLGSTGEVRRDCNMVVRLLSMGVIPESKVQDIIHRAADKLLQNDITDRDFAALLRVVTSAAKLQLEAAPQQHSHEHHGTISVEQRAVIEEARSLIAEAERRGIVVNGKVVEVHSASTDGEASRISKP